MKSLLTICTLAVTIFSLPAFAGSATTYRNDSLGFTMGVPSMDDTLSFCDAKDHCLEFLPVD